MQIYKLLLNAANNNKAITLTPLQVRETVVTLQRLDRLAYESQTLLNATDNALAAYIEEYGSTLIDTLMEDDEIVEGEVENVVEATFGRAGENDGMDPSPEEEE